MWIFSKKYGAFNTDNLSAITPQHWCDSKRTLGYDGQCGHEITDGIDNYRKIIEALVKRADFVEVD